MTGPSNISIDRRVVVVTAKFSCFDHSPRDICGELINPARTIFKVAAFIGQDQVLHWVWAPNSVSKTARRSMAPVLDVLIRCGGSGKPYLELR